VQSAGERIRLLGNAHHVDMVWHEAVRPDLQIALRGILGEKGEVLIVITRLFENRLPVISPLCDMVGISDGYSTGYSGHGRNYTRAKARVSINK
jgi:hypothetical protein